MPKLKKSERAKFLDCISNNIRICCKIYGIKKVSAAMGVSVSSVYSRIAKSSVPDIVELYMLSVYMGIDVRDLLKPLKFACSTEQGGESS